MQLLKLISISLLSLSQLSSARKLKLTSENLSGATFASVGITKNIDVEIGKSPKSVFSAAAIEPINAFAGYIVPSLEFLRLKGQAVNVEPRRKLIVGATCKWGPETNFVLGFYRGGEHSLAPVQTLFKRDFKQGSGCVEFDYKLGLILDVNIQSLASLLGEFRTAQANAGDKVKTRKERIDGIGSPLTLHTTITTTREKYVPIHFLNEVIQALHKRTAKMFDLIDAWTCRNKNTDKSATYYLLFLRPNPYEEFHTIKTIDPETKKVVKEEIPAPTAAPQEVLFAKMIRSALQEYSRDFDAELNAFVEDIEFRSQRTREFMETFGTGTPERLPEALARCDELRNLIPGPQ
ncbi:hypothetical protein TWF281_002989 [Arthrobotrys megalospora]